MPKLLFAIPALVALPGCGAEPAEPAAIHSSAEAEGTDVGHDMAAEQEAAAPDIRMQQPVGPD